MSQRTELPPVAVGGLGGSGTRLIAQCLQRLGYCIGHDLNAEYDNLWIALLFKRREIFDLPDTEFDTLCAVLRKAMLGGEGFTQQERATVDALAGHSREQHTAQWLRQRTQSLLTARPLLPSGQPWGWKAPNTHVVLPRLAPRFPGMHYIHVVRNGLDMAHSSNQNQLRMWGEHYVGERLTTQPRDALRFWCAANRSTISVGRALLGRRFLLLNYDAFCTRPTEGISVLRSFLPTPAEDVEDDTLRDLIHVPESIGRFRNKGTQEFAAADIDYVRELGFDTD